MDFWKGLCFMDFVEAIALGIVCLEVIFIFSIFQ
jgi:hypothetical protein